MISHNDNPWLRWAAGLTMLAALAHFLIIAGGPDWYRFFGAGEAIARLAAQGHWYPPVLTTVLALVLTTWAFYAWSGAGMMRRLPGLGVALAMVSLIFFARALFGFWLVHAPAVADAHLLELQQRPLFLLGSSLYCLALAACYSLGLVKLKRCMQRTRWNQLSG